MLSVVVWSSVFAGLTAAYAYHDDPDGFDRTTWRLCTSITEGIASLFDPQWTR
jgi:hypothetical protein